MSGSRRGLFRVEGEDGQPNMAFVEGGTLGFYVAEQEYRQKGFEPDFDELPYEPQYCELDKKEKERKRKE